MTRREILQALGVGIAVSSMPAVNAAPAPAIPDKTAKLPPSIPAQPFSLPSLSYGYDALEPHIDARTMEIHLTKHHQAYIDGANRALAEFPQWQKKTATELLHAGESLPEKLRTPVRNLVGGHVNHSLFWKVIGPKAGKGPRGELATAIDKTFGSFDAFQARFTDAAMKRFGSGWTWLSVSAQGTLLIHSTPNQDSPFMDRLQPILGLDVWEHAYYLRYQNRRLEYVDAFYRVIHWPEVETNFAEAQKTTPSA